MAIEKP